MALTGCRACGCAGPGQGQGLPELAGPGASSSPLFGPPGAVARAFDALSHTHATRHLLDDLLRLRDSRSHSGFCVGKGERLTPLVSLLPVSRLRLHRKNRSSSTTRRLPGSRRRSLPRARTSTSCSSSPPETSASRVSPHQTRPKDPSLTSLRYWWNPARGSRRATLRS